MTLRDDIAVVANALQQGGVQGCDEFQAGAQVLAAARRVAEAPEVWWCEVHGVGHRIEGSPRICAAYMGPYFEEEDCRMVRKLLVDPDNL